MTYPLHYNVSCTVAKQVSIDAYHNKVYQAGVSVNGRVVSTNRQVQTKTGLAQVKLDLIVDSSVLIDETYSVTLNTQVYQVLEVKQLQTLSGMSGFKVVGLG